MKPRYGFPDIHLAGWAFFACFLGTLIVVDSSYAASIARGEGVFAKGVLAHLACVGLGLGLAWLLSRIGPSVWSKLGWLAYTLAFVSAVVLVFLFGVEQNSAKSWIEIQGIRLQPSEFAKVGLIAFLASVLARRPEFQPTGRLGGTARYLDHVVVPGFVRFVPFLFALGLAGWVALEDLGTGSIMVAIVLAMMFVGNVRLTSLAALTAVLVVGAIGAVRMEDYRWQRFARHYERWADHNVSDIGYQTTQSELALAQGGIFGVGLGDGRLKHILPAATNDFVFGTIGEEVGLVGGLIAMGVLAALAWRFLKVARLAPDAYGTMFCTGMAAWIAVQSSVNILMATGAIPAIGVPLPFFSAGGSSVLALWMGIGIAMGSLRQPAAKKVAKEAKQAPKHPIGALAR